MADEETNNAGSAEVGRRGGHGTNRSSDTGRSDGSRRSRKGMPPALEAMLTEHSEELEARITAWVADYHPSNPAELVLVQRAAQLSWKLDRLNQYETSILSAKVRDAVRHADEARRDRLDAVACALIPSAGTREASGSETCMHSELVRELEAAAEGCRWLMKTWRTLREPIERSDAWTDEQERMTSRLLGGHRGPTLDSDLSDLVVANRVLRRAKSSQLDRLGECSPDRKTASAALLTEIDRILARLEALQVDRERNDSAENARKTAANLASFDPSPEGERLRRYQHATHREFLKAVEALAALRSRRS